ncbi:MAG: undecaprenyldiphospho-muramoylpentapeptide beta-N-acetylglucosaminyltransferase [Corynebacteriales bacterium]|nr:undecaprenyldiphospho-muramoylpentapeptide beta-N-acetylglucosaminyltransferase [Mycobacteriales bacterium]
MVLAGGGTGGHIEPALALADCLRRHDPQVRITCLGTPKGLEAEIIPARGWDLELIPAYPLPRRPGAELLMTPGRISRSVSAARAVMDKVQADVVVGFGGYVALPAYLGAWRRGTPMVVHEVNNPAGLANKVGARFTPFVGLGGDHVKMRAGEVVGVPLRYPIATLDRDAQRDKARAFFGLEPDRPTLLVFGGSQGARSVNLAVASAAVALGAAGIQVLHVIGARNTLENIPQGTGAPYIAVPFVEEMELAFAAADVTLCRGGALTCAELAAVGMPAVYVPLPWGNGEQRRNAQPVVNAGGGLLVEDGDLNGEWIVDNLIPLLTNQTALEQMSMAAARFGKRDGDEALRALVLRACAQVGKKANS